jgi:hypothetical protein
MWVASFLLTIFEVLIASYIWIFIYFPRFGGIFLLYLFKKNYAFSFYLNPIFHSIDSWVLFLEYFCVYCLVFSYLLLSEDTNSSSLSSFLIFFILLYLIYYQCFQLRFSFDLFKFLPQDFYYFFQNLNFLAEFLRLVSNRHNSFIYLFFEVFLRSLINF